MKNSIFNLPSPLTQVHYNEFSFWIKRDDLIHPYVSGNKWRKLSGFLEAFPETSTIVTYGGAYSNHIHATSALCNHLDLKCVLKIRGSEALQFNNPTILDVKSLGAKIVPVERSAYNKEKYNFSYKNKVLTIPEGGAGKYGYVGLKGVWDELATTQLSVQKLILPVGSGTSFIGLAKSAPANVDIYGIAAVRDNSLLQVVSKELGDSDHHQLLFGYEQGGFAKKNAKLLDFIVDFEAQTGIVLDFIYNAKAVMALLKLIAEKNWSEDIVYLHTGGLQGNRSLCLP